MILTSSLQSLSSIDCDEKRDDCTSQRPAAGDESQDQYGEEVHKESLHRLSQPNTENVQHE